jgi:hypothetical protein
MDILFVMICAVCTLCYTHGSRHLNNTLVVVPGMSSLSNRTNTVISNLELLYQYHPSDLHCLVHYYSYSPSFFPATIKTKLDSFGCTLQYFHESNHYADYMKSVLPSFVRHGQFQYVMILLDDVELQSNFRYVIIV